MEIICIIILITTLIHYSNYVMSCNVTNYSTTLHNTTLLHYIHKNVLYCMYACIYVFTQVYAYMYVCMYMNK